MASNIVKCANCNVVINELLAFIQNQADFMDEVSLTRICSDSFTDSEIVAAKGLLFDSIPNSKRKVRKSKGRGVRDIEDMICLLKLTDPEIVPIFVARDLRKLPPVGFDHIDATKLLKDILVLQTDIKVLKNECATASQLLELRTEVDNLKSASIVHNNFDFVNRRRGAFLEDIHNFDSGPMALQQHSNSKSNDKSPKSRSQSIISDYFPKYVGMQKRLLSTPDTVNERSAGGASATENVKPSDAVSLAQRFVNTGESQQRKQNITPTARSNLINSNVNTNNAAAPRGNERKSMADVLKASNKCEEIVGEKWNVVTNKKHKKPSSRGKMGKAQVGPDGKFKAAIIKVPLFISNVCRTTNESDIIAYIKKSTQEDVTLFKINRKTEKRYNSFKLYVPKVKLELFLDNELWPDGITFRRFVNETYKMKTGIIKQTITQ